MKPNLSSDAPTIVTAFAGGGGVETGAVMAGIRPIASVELDPTMPNLSAALADANDLNFVEYGHKVIRRSIQDCADELPTGDIFHASPVCTNFSLAKRDRGERSLDVEMAEAVTRAIASVQPRVVTIENVPAYRKSQSWEIIRSHLWKQGYWVSEVVLDAADFGTPQRRRRFFGIGVKNAIVREIQPQGVKIGWWDAIKSFAYELPETTLLPVEKNAIKPYGSATPLLIERSGYRNGTPRVLTKDEPMWTILRRVSCNWHNSEKDKMSDLSRFIDIITDDGIARQADGRCLARRGGFPGWYQMPKSLAVTGSIVGYSVPPPLYRGLISQIANLSP
jgi:DNA (cytosine-5)-methyltransferase 1